jgi:signal transduction histidine kinase
MITSVVTELINSATSKSLKLVYNKPNKDTPLIYADPDKLREVVLNLIDNAIKYTPKGSVDISIQTDAANLTFTCKDSGIGIDPEEAKTLFRKFVRGDGVAQIYTGGSGLGLFIAQKIVKEHAGRIWVESTGKGHGSAFKFEVPLATPAQIEESNKKK